MPQYYIECGMRDNNGRLIDTTNEECMGSQYGETYLSLEAAEEAATIIKKTCRQLAADGPEHYYAGYATVVTDIYAKE